MTPQEKLILRFLLTVLVVGLIVGYVRRTWFWGNPETLENPEVIAREVAVAAEKNRARYINTRDIDSHEYSDTSRWDLQKWTEGKKVNLNVAPMDELMLLPGVGHVLAERIVLYRQDSGAFESVEDLTDVRGIGRKTVQRLRPYVIVDSHERIDKNEEKNRE